MRLLDCDTAEAYLREAGRVGPKEPVRVRRLAGGVSNEVLYVERGDAAHDDFVLKQARPQLRVADPWFCSVERVWREVETLRVCENALRTTFAAERDDGQASVSVPRVLFEDRDHYLFSMTAAPPHEVWKQRLLAGCVEMSLAESCGKLLSALHAGTWRDDETAARLGDQSFFEDLRVDPYYRRVARVHDDLQAPIADLIDSLSANCLCLVHGDFSPKNLLVYEVALSRPSAERASHVDRPPHLHEKLARRNGVMLVDFEVGHFGDPAFDLGFFLTHLVLKAFWSGPRFEEYFQLTHAFWKAYREGISRVASPDELQALTGRAIRNFAACVLARLDGKSPVEYLSDPQSRDEIRRFAKRLLHEQPATWEEAEPTIRHGAQQRPGGG